MKIGALGRSRTDNPSRRRRTLYPVELQGRIGAVGRTRTGDTPIRSRMLWFTELKGQGGLMRHLQAF